MAPAVFSHSDALARDKTVDRSEFNAIHSARPHNGKPTCISVPASAEPLLSWTYEPPSLSNLSRRLYLAALTALSFLILVISPVSAAPSLALGSQASYNLSGLLEASQTCAADPAQYTLPACTPGGPRPPPPPVQSPLVAWVDDGYCYSNSPSCRFDPSFLGIETGTRVQWFHKGTLSHTATANITANPGLPGFDSGVAGPGSNFTYTFSVPGTYHYYCSIHRWMTGIVSVFSAPPPPPMPPPMPTSMKVNLDGNIAWTVKGLSPDIANLKVDHEVGISISPQPGLTFTPLTEKGSFEQTIILATRVESPGTATSIILNILRSIMRSAPIYGTRTAQIYTGPGSVASPADSTSIVTGVATSSVPSLTPMFLRDGRDPVYTMWWVNGPLTLGTPVQVLTGWSSVTGDENLNLGTALGARAGWVVTSQFSQSFNANSPQGQAFSVSFALNLLWSFDKKGDLLLRSNADIPITATTVSRQQIITGNPCGPSGWCPTFAEATVTRIVKANLNLALRLASTDLNLNERTDHGSTRSSSFLEALATMPWLPLGATGAAGATLVGACAWYARRVRGKTIETGTAPPLPS